MLRSGWLLLLALLAQRTVLPAPLEAAEPKVNDRAEFFSKSAVEHAKRKIQEIHRRFKVEVVIETFPSIPDNMKAQYKPEREGRPVLSPLGRDAGGRRRRERHLRVDLQESGAPANRTRSNRPARRLSRLQDRDALVKRTTEAHAAEAVRCGPSEMVDSIESTLEANLGQRAVSRPARVPIPASVATGPLRPQRFPNEAREVRTQSSGLLGWVCLGVVAFFWSSG